MRKRRRRFAVPLVVLVLIASCANGDDDAASPSGKESASSESASPPSETTRRIGGVDIAEVGTEVPPAALPYPFLTPAPPLAPTPIDGTYLRILTFKDLGGPGQASPIRCLRCPPYYPHIGVSSLMFHEGRYWVDHQLSGFRSLGNYTVVGRTLTLFNDPYCPQDRGRYRWALHGRRLTVELLGGDCVSEGARATDLGLVPWTKIDPCTFRFEHLWPARPECAI